MRLKAITLLIFTILTFGCGNSETTNSNQNSVNTPKSNTNATTNAANTLETTKKPEVATTNNAPTLTPVIKAYCEAIIKKDDAALRKVYSQETLKIFEKDMKEENKKSLAEFLAELDPIKDVNQCSARNERIEGDKAFANIKNENMQSGIDIEFVKENGEWKLTNKSSDFDSVKQSATNSNTAK